MLRAAVWLTAFLAVSSARAVEPTHSAELDEMIVRQAKRHGVPEKLVRRIVMRESRYNPRARNHSFWGLMQISYPTAKSMGFKGNPKDLLDPLVNLTYAVPYLANAFIIAGKQEDAAVRLYASGYYATAKSRNLLDQLRTAESTPVVPDEGFLTATARPVSNLITAVVNGPPPLPAVAAVAPAGSAPGDPGGVEPEALMVNGKKGYEPPKKWIKDGGVTSIAKGDQKVEQIAAFSAGESSKTPHAKGSHGKTRKIVEFALLDAPSANAQAYAAAASAPAESGAQNAIIQATAPVAAPAEQGAGAAAAADDAKAPVAPQKTSPKTKQARAAAKKAPRSIALATKEPVASAPATP